MLVCNTGLTGSFTLRPNKDAHVGALGLDSVSQVTQVVPLLPLSPTKN